MSVRPHVKKKKMKEENRDKERLCEDIPCCSGKDKLFCFVFSSNEQNKPLYITMLL